MFNVFPNVHFNQDKILKYKLKIFLTKLNPMFIIKKNIYSKK